MTKKYNEHKYYHRRYYNFVNKKILNFDPETLIEVGPANPILSATFNIPAKEKVWIDTSSKEEVGGYSLDLFNIIFTQGNIMATNVYSVKEKYDLLVCLQTLEHIKDPKTAINNMWGLAENKIFSVPYNWDPIPGHVHNNILPETFLSWFPETCFKSFDIIFERRDNGINLTGRMVVTF